MREVRGGSRGCFFYTKGVLATRGGRAMRSSIDKILSPAFRIRINPELGSFKCKQSSPRAFGSGSGQETLFY